MRYEVNAVMSFRNEQAQNEKFSLCGKGNFVGPGHQSIDGFNAASITWGLNKDGCKHMKKQKRKV